MIDPGLKEKVVLITGANNPHGIGAGIARAFAAQGAKVFLHYLRQTTANVLNETAAQADTPGVSFYHSQLVKSAEEVLTEIRKTGVEADAWEADLGDASLIPVVYDQAEHKLGPVEIVVNNAAYWEADSHLQEIRSMSSFRCWYSFLSY